MNLSVIVGGGLILLGFAYAATIPLFHSFWIPRGGRMALYAMAGGSAISASMCGLAILLGVDVLALSRGSWAAFFVTVQLLGLWSFNAVLAVEIYRRGDGGSGSYREEDDPGVPDEEEDT